MKKQVKMLVYILLIGFILLNEATVYGSQIETFGEEKKVPILMYHFLSKNIKKPNKWLITVDEFEEDLKYLSEQGYEGVFIKDLIDYVYEGKALPEKPVVITFDDGDSSVHRYALELLQKYNMKAVLSIIGEPTDKYSNNDNDGDKYYPNLTWKQIKDLHDSGLIEIQSHTYDLHKGIGVARKKGESQEQYAARLVKDLAKLQLRTKEELGEESTAIAFPFGKYSDTTHDILKENGFLASLTCYERVNIIKMGVPDSLFGMGRFLRPRGTNSQSILKKFQDNP